MIQRRSGILKELEEYAFFIHTPGIYSKNKAFMSKIHKIHRESGFQDLNEAIKIYMQTQINQSLKPDEYEQFCRTMMDYGFESLIILVPDENLRLKYLKRMENQKAKAMTLASLSDDDTKMEFSKGLKLESNRVSVYSSLSTDQKKESCLAKIKDYHKQADLVASFEDDDLKVEYIFSGVIHSSCISTIVASMKDDTKKEELIDLIPSDTARLRVILSIKDIEIRRRLYDEKLVSNDFKERHRTDLILSYPLVEQLHYFSECAEKVKYMILRNCDYKTQLRLLPELSDSNNKSMILEFIPETYILEYMKDHYSDETNRWVRTDSEEREANVPRDDREQIVREIVKYSNISDESKIKLLNTYVKNQQSLKNILAEMPYEFVISKYFGQENGIVNLELLDKIQTLYDIESREDITFSAIRGFDFDSEKNQVLIQRLRKMKYPKFSLSGMPYQEYKKWNDILIDSDVILIADSINITGQNLSAEELDELSAITRYVVIDGKFMTDINRYRQATELIREIMPNEDDERFNSIRQAIEIQLSGCGQIGATLVAAKEIFNSAGFSEEETKRYGERLLLGLLNFEHEKYPKLRFAIDSETIDVIQEWDSSKRLLIDNLVPLSSEMTQEAIKRTIETAAEDGFITEEFAVDYVLDYMIDKPMSEDGLKYAKVIALELMKKQDLKVQDINKLVPGAYSDVFEIGDYVLKLGFERKTKTIPKHPRILPSLLRFEVKKDDEAPSTFIEVQPRIIPLQSLQSMEGDGVESRMYEVFRELRMQEVLWGDVAERNLGYIPVRMQKHENIFKEFKVLLQQDEHVVIYHSDENVNEPIVSDNINDPYLLIIDTDFLYQLGELSEEEHVEIPSSFSMEFDERFKQEREMERKQSKIATALDKVYAEVGWD